MSVGEISQIVMLKALGEEKNMQIGKVCIGLNWKEVGETLKLISEIC